MKYLTGFILAAMLSGCHPTHKCLDGKLYVIATVSPFKHIPIYEQTERECVVLE